MLVGAAALDRAARLAFLPLSLLLSFGLFQFVCMVFYHRRRQLRVLLLLASAFVGSAALVSLAYPDPELLRRLNSVSETCATLTFLLQIAIIGRDSSKKQRKTNQPQRLQFIGQLTLLAELLAAIQVLVMLLEIVEMLHKSPVSSGDTLSISRQARQVIQVSVLAFSMIFRFFYVSALVGVRQVLRLKRAELVAYSLLVTYTLPFAVLEDATQLSWELARGLNLRMLIVLYLWLTFNCLIRPRRSGRTQCMQPKRSDSGSGSGKSCEAAFDRFQASESRHDLAEGSVLRSAAVVPFDCSHHDLRAPSASPD